MVTLNCREQAKEIYEICIKTKRCLTYEEVLDSLGYEKGVSEQAIRYGLELVLIACAELGLPILTSIVVNKSTRCPSAGNYPDGWEAETRYSPIKTGAMLIKLTGKTSIRTVYNYQRNTAQRDIGVIIDDVFTCVYPVFW